MISPGRYSNLTFEEYQALQFVTYGILRAVRKCPAKAQLMLGHRVNEPASEAQRMGVAIHHALLEPIKFDFEYKGSRCRAIERTKQTRCDKRAYVRSAGFWYCRLHATGLEADIGAPATADESEIETCRSIREAFEAHAAVRGLLEMGLESEVSLVWKEPDFGFECKCRPDLLAYDGTIAVDLKTSTYSVHHSSFRKRVVASGYLQQAAFTRMACWELGIPLREYYIVALETPHPYCVAVYRLRSQDIDWAQSELSDGLARLSSCLSSGLWPGYEGIQELIVPDFLKEQADSVEPLDQIE